MKRVSTTLKPALQDYHYFDRVNYCISQIDLTRNRFKPNYNVIHIDVKWFHLKQVTKKIYLHKDEPEPVQKMRHKNHITKVMFLAAVARPRFDPHPQVWFDGKIGIWPIVHLVAAQRNSRNRPAGTMELKCQSLTKDVNSDYICNEVIPSITDKWPASFRNKPIFIQQDNASPHTPGGVFEQDWINEVDTSGLDIRRLDPCQPAQSPDLNVLDLGYFRAREALQQKRQANTIEELIEAVEDSFEALKRITLKKVFITHQTMVEQVILHEGSNDFKIKHLNKDKIIREQGRLPEFIPLTDELKAKIEQLCPGTIADTDPLGGATERMTQDGDAEAV